MRKNNNNRTIFAVLFTLLLLAGLTTANKSFAQAADPCLSIITIPSGCPTAAQTLTMVGAGNAAWSATGPFTVPGDEQIYSYTPTTSGMHQLNVTANVGGSWFDYSWKVASGGCTPTGWTFILDVAGTATVNFGPLTSGVPIYLLVNSETTVSKTQTFNLNCGPCVTTAMTNTCPTSGAQSLTLVGAGDPAWSATGPFSVPGGERVYTYTPLTTGVHTLNVTSNVGGSWFDYSWKLQSGGCSPTGWTFIIDAAGTGTFSFGPLTAGVPIFILVNSETTASKTQTFNIGCPAGVNPCAAITPITNTCPTSVPQTLTLTGPGNPSWSATGPFTVPGGEKIYSYVPTVTGQHTLNVTANVGGSWFDYSWKLQSGGCSPTGWTFIIDAAGVGTFSPATFTLTAGVPIYILVNSETTASKTQTFNIQCAIPPVDPCTTITPISVTCGSPVNTSVALASSGSFLNFGTICSNPVSTPFSTLGQEKAFSFVAPVSGMYGLTMVSTVNLDNFRYMWRNASTGCVGMGTTGWNCIGLVGNPGFGFSFGPLVAGNTYIILVDRQLTITTSMVTQTFQVTCPAPNDLCTGALPITFATCPGTTTLTGTTTGASVDGGLSGCTNSYCGPGSGPTCPSSTPTQPGIWYTLVGSGGLIKLSTCPPTVQNSNTMLSVFTSSDGTCPLPPPPPTTIASGTVNGEIQAGPESASVTGLSCSGSGGTFSINISGGWQDAVSWQLVGFSGAILATGGPYGNGTNTTVNVVVPGSEVPATFNIEAAGAASPCYLTPPTCTAGPTDNIANYVITCTAAASGAVFTCVSGNDNQNAQIPLGGGVNCTTYAFASFVEFSSIAGQLYYIHISASPAAGPAGTVGVPFTLTANCCPAIAVPTPIVPSLICGPQQITLDATPGSGGSSVVWRNSAGTVIPQGGGSVIASGSATGEIQAGPETASSTGLSCSGSGGTFIINLSGGWQDAVSWQLVGASSAILASGGPYGLNTITTVSVSVPTSEVPATFNIEAAGAASPCYLTPPTCFAGPTDNIVNYTISCSTPGISVFAFPSPVTFTVETVNGTCRSDKLPVVVQSYPDVDVTPVALTPVCESDGTSISAGGVHDNEFVNTNDFIADGAIIAESPIAISAIGTGAQVFAVKINIATSWTGDASISLIAPNLATVDLSSGNGGAGDNFTNTFITPLAPTLITTGVAPFTGAFKPEAGSFAAIAGSPLFGTWKLRYQDNVNDGGIDGTLLDWTLYAKTPDGIIYSWSPTLFQDNGDGTGFDFPAPGTTTYSVTGSDALGGPCTASGSVDVDVAENPSITYTSTPTTCAENCDGTIDIVATGGTGNYLYIIDGVNIGAGASNTGLCQSELTSFGDYVIAVIDDNLALGVQCLSNIEVLDLEWDDDIPPTITCPANIILPSCVETATWDDPAYDDNCIGEDLSAPSIPKGSSFANGTTTEISYTVTDTGGNETSCSFTVERRALLTVNLGPDQSFLFGCTCADLIPVTAGGNPPYSYNWSHGETSLSAIEVCPGLTTTYSVTVTDADGCTAVSAPVTIIKPALINQLDRYVVMGLGTQDDEFGNQSEVMSGFIGHLRSLGKLKLQNNSVVIQSMVGKTVELGNQNSVGTLYRTTTSSMGSGNVIGSTVTPVSTPLVPSIPCFPTFSGGSNIEVNNGATVTLSPGTYNEVKLNNNSTLILNPGIYKFFKLQTGNDSYIVPASPATAGDVLIFVKDQVQTGNDNVVSANIYAKKEIQFGETTTSGALLNRGTYTGSFLSDIKVKSGNKGEFHLDAYCWSDVALCSSPTRESEEELVLNEGASSLVLFPNPTSGLFKLEFKGTANETFELTVTNLYGQIVYSEVINDFAGHLEKELDLSNNSSGAYLIQVRNGDNFYSEQIVVTQ